MPRGMVLIQLLAYVSLYVLSRWFTWNEVFRIIGCVTTLKN